MTVQTRENLVLNSDDETIENNNDAEVIRGQNLVNNKETDALDFFPVGKVFETYKEFESTKRLYEDKSFSILIINNSIMHNKEHAHFLNTKYKMMNLICKAGKPCSNKIDRMRNTSTGRLNGEFSLKLGNVKSKLIVKSINPIHCNHVIYKQTYMNYPEKMRLTVDEEDEATKLLMCNANKHKIKLNLMQNREAPVSLKSLHNLKTKITNSSIDQSASDLENLLKEMNKIEGSRIKVAVSDENELVGIYFQNQRMLELFNSFPEVVIFDATYKLNNRRMPVFLLMVVDGNGVSEVVCIWIIKSENRIAVEAMLDAFMEFNLNTIKSKYLLLIKISLIGWFLKRNFQTLLFKFVYFMP